jgi:hypothetical protein
MPVRPGVSDWELRELALEGLPAAEGHNAVLRLTESTNTAVANLPSRFYQALPQVCLKQIASNPVNSSVASYVNVCLTPHPPFVGSSQWEPLPAAVGFWEPLRAVGRILCTPLGIVGLGFRPEHRKVPTGCPRSHNGANSLSKASQEKSPRLSFSPRREPRRFKASRQIRELFDGAAKTRAN